MRIISLLEDQAQMIYFKYLVHDFHKKEIKPWEHIKKLLDRQNYLCLGLFDEENTLFAYAFFCTSQDSSWLFLDYYAVCTEYRGQGYRRRHGRQGALRVPLPTDPGQEDHHLRQQPGGNRVHHGQSARNSAET